MNLLTIADNGAISGASDYSAIVGPIKKVGNDAFTFPFGEVWTGPPPIFAVPDYVFHPLTISAPSNPTDAFTAQYFSANHNKGTNADSTIENESTCEYWKLTRNSGSSNVTVKLGWNWNSCNVYGLDSMHVAVWDTATSKWKDKGNGGATGNLTSGTVVSSSAISTFGIMTLADKFCTTLNHFVTSTDVKCKGGTNGYSIETVSGATPPYNYLWSENKGTTNSAINLTAGIYSIFVNDSRGCTRTDTAVISEPDTLEISISSTTKSSCGDSTGTAVVTHSGGVGTLKYVWSPYGGVDSTAESLTSGPYFVLLTDSFGCIAGMEVYISDTAGPSVSVDSSFNVTCAGLSDGRAYISVASGVSPFTYSWIPSSDTTSYSYTLDAGTSYLEVTDSNGCRTFESINITEPDPITLSVYSTKSTCGQATGTATVYASGGSGSFAYYWSPSGGRNSFETNITAGYDTITVVDSLGCISISSVYIEDTLAPIISSFIIANNVCTDSSLGSARVLVSGGTPPYEYLWLPDSSTNDTVTNLKTGFYNIFVTDSNGCKVTSSLVIEEPPPLIISMFGTNASGDTINDGVAGVYVTGGTPPYSYIWLPDSETTATIAGKGDGSYTVFVTDNNGCSRSGIFYLSGGGCSLNFICDSLSDTICMPMQYPNPPNSFSVVDIVDDFFADPTGNSSSECAFEAAVNYFMNNLVGGVPGNGILNIPHGTYIVGYQYHPSDNSNYLIGHDVLCFQGCQNITIEGKVVGTPPKIKFYDCIKYGTFDPVTGKRFLHSPGCYNSNDPDCPDSSVPDPACICNPIGRTWVQPEAGYSAWPGNIFLFDNSTSITLRNLELDGNTDNASIGGYFAIDLAGINLAYDGILFNSCADITIDNLNVHHFGRDGIVINDRVGLGGNGLPPIGIPMNLTITNSKFNWNGRNGMSWVGGNGVNVLRSEFNYNGQARISTNPRDGLDIEWENCNSRVEHGFFKDCNFMFNVRCGIESSAQNNRLEAWSNDFMFEGCKFVGSETAICARPNARGMVFKKSQFFGIVNGFYDAWRCSICVINPFRNKFINSSFSEEYNNQYSINSNTFDECLSGCGFGHDYMINMYLARCAEFADCKFTTNYTMQVGSFVADWNNDYWNFAQYTYCIFSNNGLNATITDANNPVPPCNVCALDWLYMRGAFFNPPQSISFHAPNAIVNNLWCGNTFYYHSENVANAIGYFPLIQSFADLTPVNCLPKFYQTYPNRVTDLYSGPCNPPDCYSLEDEFCPAMCYPPCNQRTINLNAEEPKHQIAVFPNPSQSAIYISNVQKGQEILIYNTLGNCLFKTTSEESPFPVDITLLPEGVYIVRVDGIVAVRFIKTK